MKNRVCELFQIQYPVIQGGMVWCSGWELASAVSNSGGLGLIGAGSMEPETLEEHIIKTKKSTDNPFGVNLPLLKPNAKEHIEVMIRNKVPIVFTSAGNPAKWTSTLKEHGITVAHVIANTMFAKKCEEAGVDAIVAEGFEAGGHNGREETTTLTLIPLVKNVTHLPLIAAGGIASGRAMYACMSLGAEGVQIGSRFAASKESSAHPDFKKKITELKEGDTQLSLKKLVPVRMVKNAFFHTLHKAEYAGEPISSLLKMLGKGRSRKGIFEGDLEEGELEIGQVSALIDSIEPVEKIMKDMLQEFIKVRDEMKYTTQFI